MVGGWTGWCQGDGTGGKFNGIGAGVGFEIEGAGFIFNTVGCVGWQGDGTGWDGEKVLDGRVMDWMGW